MNEDRHRWSLTLGIILLLSALLGALLFFSEKSKQQRLAGEERARQEALLRSIPEINARARDLLMAGEFHAALEALEPALQQTNAPLLLETRLDILLNANRPHEAYEALQALIRLRPAEPHLHYIAGNLAFNYQGPRQSLAHYRSAVEQAPQNFDYLAALSLTLALSGHEEEGVALAEKLLADAPANHQAWNHYVGLLTRLGQLDRALAIRRQAVQQFPEDWYHHFSLGVALDQSAAASADEQQAAEAVRHYRQSLELRPMRNSVAAQRIHQITGTRVPPELEAQSPDEIPLTVHGKVMFIQLQINGVEGRFILDTGASYLSLHEASAQKFKVKSGQHSLEVKTASGTVQAPLAFADVQLGRYTLSSTPVLILPNADDPDFHGLLGMDILEKFIFDLDRSGQRLLLRGFNPAAEP